MDSRRQEILREYGRCSGVRRGCGEATWWLVGSWHHHRFDGKVEIVGCYLKNNAAEAGMHIRRWRTTPARHTVAHNVEPWALCASARIFIPCSVSSSRVRERKNVRF
ncbi:hypothetical protein QL285_076534 [Trifolium repens]|nr:hypothetical protein QL285_076534 [Trifolium repens]